MEVTEKRLTANRENARKSTGPKTEMGKVTTRLNAVKHGILSDSVVISQGDGKEKTEAYEQLLNSMEDYFAPQGAMEEALVEQIAITLWRKRRVLRFEIGSLRSYLDGFQTNAKKTGLFRFSSDRTACEQFAEIERQIAFHQAEKEALEENYDILSDKDVDDWEESYRLLAGNLGIGSCTPRQVRDHLQKAGLSESQIRQELVKGHKEQMEDAKRELKTLQPLVTMELDRLGMLGSIPDVDAMDKIIRYETSLDRQLYKAIAQLERLQRRRGGEDLPAPIVLEQT